MTERDKVNVIERYSKRFEAFGYDPQTLGWTKGKQLVRFDLLTSHLNLRGKTILDIGCGFGDLNKLLQIKYGTDYEYIGVDLVPALVEQGQSLFGSPKVRFVCGDFLSSSIDFECDLVVASGIFNFKLSDGSNYEFIEESMSKAFRLCRVGFAFDFLSDRVNFKRDDCFHSSPEHVLTHAYKLSRNVVLRNDCMPFEFAILVNKLSTFDERDTIFHSYKDRHAWEGYRSELTENV